MGKITVGGATMNLDDYKQMLLRNADRRAKKREDDAIMRRIQAEHDERKRIAGVGAAPKADPLDLDPLGRPAGGSATTQPGQWRERVVRIDPFTRPRGPATHHAVQDVVSQMQGSSSPNRTTISSGRDIRARRQVENEQAMIGAYREAGMPLGGIQAMAQEESAERDMARRQAGRAQERAAVRAEREAERQALKQEYLDNIDAALDTIETTDLPGNASAWAIKNEMMKLQQQRADLVRYAGHGGDPKKVKANLGEIEGKLAGGAVRLQEMAEQEQAAQQGAQAAAEEQAEAREEQEAVQKQEMAEEKQAAELKMAQYKVQADIAKMDIDAAQERYKAAVTAETELAKEIGKLRSEKTKAEQAH